MASAPVPVCQASWYRCSQDQRLVTSETSDSTPLAQLTLDSETSETAHSRPAQVERQPNLYVAPTWSQALDGACSNGGAEPVSLAAEPMSLAAFLGVEERPQLVTKTLHQAASPVMRRFWDATLAFRSAAPPSPGESSEEEGASDRGLRRRSSRRPQEPPQKLQRRRRGPRRYCHTRRVAGEVAGFGLPRGVPSDISSEDLCEFYRRHLPAGRIHYNDGGGWFCLRTIVRETSESSPLPVDSTGGTSQLHTVLPAGVRAVTGGTSQLGGSS